jgi:hypothetical protein
MDLEFKDGVATLAITTHGDIQVRPDSEGIDIPITYTIPKDMKIIALHVVSPGIPNLLPPENTKNFIDIVKKHTIGFNADSDLVAMKSMLKRIRKELIEVDNQPQEAADEIRKKNIEYTGDEEIKAYFHHADLLYYIRNYKTNKPFNKEFLRENNLIRKSGKNMYDWKINLLNMKKPRDLMDDLNPNVSSLRSSRTRSVFTITYLGNVIDYLYNQGVRKIIIVDFSCSVIRKKQSGVSKRTERHVSLTHMRTIRKTKKIREPTVPRTPPLMRE